MDLMIDRKELDKALRQVLQGLNAAGPDVVDFTARRDTLTVVVTGRSVEVAIEAAEVGSISIPIEIAARLRKIGKTYENERLRLRAGEGRIRLEGMSITNPGIRMRKIARRVIDVPQDARPMDLLGLRHIFTVVEIEDSGLGARVLDAEKKLADRLDSAARSLTSRRCSWLWGPLAARTPPVQPARRPALPCNGTQSSGQRPRDLADYGISRNELRALAEARIREGAPGLRKALLSE